ncbi:hypothetical protein L0657_13270 [Dyadobacter sp. CY345]|uniref:hypothetical protein n=1 Tax=Dyadobacter sp. CY345 TaxID=2909335 RepID=UPI001F1E317E|nr:hypothetical protein [Dyadobacter sp. CY345]MCF2444932.1 hypothetical protein [Dyadobacter sp. CY345]
MISKRKEPDVLTRSKPILDAPIFPDYPTNTPEGRSPKDDPDLLRKSDKNDDVDVTNELEEEDTDNLDDEKVK